MEQRATRRRPGIGVAHGKLQQGLEVELLGSRRITEHLRRPGEEIGVDARQVGRQLREEKAYVLRALGDIILLGTAGSDEAGLCTEST